MFYPARNLPFSVLAILSLMLAGFMAMMAAPGQVVSTFGLVPAKVLKDFWAWQMLTYMVLHGGMLHLLFNMLSVYLFGGPLAQIWGEGRFVGYFLFCGIGAALTTLLVMPTSTVATIGASGAIYGLLYAWAREFPDSVIYLYGLFPMRAKHFVFVMAAVELMLSQMPSPIARFAHLGGFAFGWIYFRLPDFSEGFRVVNISKIRWEREATQEDVDRILEKISKNGMDSLSADERQILDRFSRSRKGQRFH